MRTGRTARTERARKFMAKGGVRFFGEGGKFVMEEDALIEMGMSTAWNVF